MTDLAEAWPRGATPRLRSGAAARRSFPTSEVRGGSQEELPHVQGQGRWPRGATTGAGGPRGATPHSRSGGTAVRRYPSSKVRETQVRGQKGVFQKPPRGVTAGPGGRPTQASSNHQPSFRPTLPPPRLSQRVPAELQDLQCQVTQ